MTTTYTQEPTTYAWSESDRPYVRPYISPEARSGWYDGYGPMDRPNRIATPDPVPQSGNSASLRKAAVAAAMLAALGGGALLGTFVLGNSESAPNPSVYVVPETNGAPAAPPAPETTPPAQGAPNTILVPGNRSATTVVVPPANRGPAPAAVAAPPAVAPAAPRPVNVAPPPPPASVVPPQVRIEGISIPIPVPAQTPGLFAASGLPWRNTGLKQCHDRSNT